MPGAYSACATAATASERPDEDERQEDEREKHDVAACGEQDDRGDRQTDQEDEDGGSHPRRVPSPRGAKPTPSGEGPSHAARSSSSACTALVNAGGNFTSSWIPFTRSTPALRSAVASTLPTRRSSWRIGRA